MGIFRQSELGIPRFDIIHSSLELDLQIVSFVDDEPQPGLVACELVDAEQHCHTIIDKVLIFVSFLLDSGSKYPQPGTIRCEEIARWRDDRGRDLIRVRTPGVETTEGLSEFVVLLSQLSSAQPTCR